MKKVLSLLLALVFVVAAFPVTIASAADVIEISDAAQLASIGTNDNYPLSGSYKLTKNINLKDYDSWTPIGQSSAFSGTFEGNGKTISGLKVNTSGTYAGLFGQVSGTIKNLTVTGSVTLNATSSGATNAYAGILAGNVSGWFATIDSCSTSGEVSATLNCTTSWGFGSANVYAGGVVGNNSSMIGSEILSHKSGTVTATYSGSKVTGNVYAGGIAGKATGALTDCYNKADVISSTSKGSSYAGGLAGQCGATETSYNTGTITAGTYAGGIAGYTSGSSKNCYYLSGSASSGFGGSSGSSTPTATSKSKSDMYNKKLSGFNFDDVWESSPFTTPNHYTVNEVITGSVSVLGNFQVGEKLTADMSKVTPEKAHNGTIKYVKYQWEAGTKDSEGNITYEKISGATGNTYTIVASDMGKYIRLVVRGRFTYGGKLESKESLVTAAVPKNVKVENTDNGIKVTWDKISGASQYTIYRSTCWYGSRFGSYTSVGTATTNSYTDSSVTNNTKYKYKVSVTMNGTESDKSQESAEITASLPCQHTWDSGKETTKATCTETGVKTYTCSACKATRTETIPALGHNYDAGVVTTPATCENTGVKTFTCANCKGTKTETIKALGHKYDSGVVTTPATCETAGTKTFTCANCNTTMTETINATGHKFSTATVTKQPTCEQTGTKTGTCTVCKKTTSETVPALGHDFSGDYVIDKNPTYDTTGEKSKYCNRCGARGEIVIIPKVEKFAAPKILTHESTEKGIKFTWSAVAGASGYAIFKLEDGIYKTKQVVTAQTRTFTDTDVVAGQTYCYAVASMDAIGNAGDYSEIAITYDYKFITSLATPVVKISDNAKGIKVTWNAIKDAESYMVYRRVYNSTSKEWSDWSKIKTGFTGTSYTDKTVKLGTKYRYTVIAVNGTVKSKYTSTETLKYDVAPTVKVANANNGIKITWTTVANAEGYTVYSSTYNTKTKKWSSWKNRGNADSSMTSWTDKNVKSGTSYKYTVRAFVNGFRSGYNKSGAKTIFLAQPTVKFQNTATGIKITWSKTAGAKNYTVYRAEYVNGKWSGWKNVGTCGNDIFACKDKGVKSGVKYRYTVRAVNGNYKSSYVTPSGLMFLAQPTVSVTKASNGIKVTWEKVSGATSYDVYRSEYNTKTKKWSSWKNIGSQKTVSYKDKTAKSGVKYKYTVRAVNGSSKSAYKASSSIKR